MQYKEVQIEITVSSQEPHAIIEHLTEFLRRVQHELAEKGEGYIEVKFSSATIEETTQEEIREHAE